MKKALPSVIALFFALSLFAQEKETVFDYSGLTLTGVWGGPLFNMSTVGEDGHLFRGGLIGLEFNKKIYISYADYYINEKAKLDAFPNQSIDITYKGLQLGYAFIPDKRIHPKISLLAAGGKVELDDEEANNVFVLQPSGGVEINLFKWCKVDVMGGYRLIKGIDTVGLSDTDVSAPFGEIKLKFGFSWGWLERIY